MNLNSSVNFTICKKKKKKNFTLLCMYVHREERNIEKGFEFLYAVAFIQTKNWTFQLILRISAGHSAKLFRINSQPLHVYWRGIQVYLYIGKQPFPFGPLFYYAIMQLFTL